MKQIILLLIIGALSSDIAAQDTWNLKRCIDYALAHNLQIHNSKLSINSREIDLKTAKAQRLPNLQFSSLAGINLGRTIDPTSNSFITATTNFNTFGVNSSVMLYNFGRIQNQIQLAALDRKSAQSDLEQARQDLALQVADAFLNVLFAKENLNNAITKRSTTQDQLQQINSLIAAGSRPANDRLDIEAQIAQDDLNITQFRNAVDLSTLRLRQIMQLDTHIPFQISVPEMDIEPTQIVDLDVPSIYAEVLRNQPSIQAFDLRLQSAKLNQKLAKSSAYPSVFLNGRVNTNYSSQAKQIDEVVLTPFESNVLINGNQSTLTTFQPRATGFSTTPYTQQLNDNIGTGLSLSLNVPIYSNYTTKANNQRAQIRVKTLQNNLELEKQRIRNQIEQAVTDLRSASLQYQAAQSTVRALEASYHNAERRFLSGTANTFEFNSITNQLEQAKINLLRAKYDFIFKSKILDFYKGKPLDLN